MKANEIKLNSKVYTFVSNNGGGISIVKCRVFCVFEHSTSFDKFVFLVETPTGEVFRRFACELYESVKAIKDDIENLVVE